MQKIFVDIKKCSVLVFLLTGTSCQPCYAMPLHCDTGNNIFAQDCFSVSSLILPVVDLLDIIGN